MTKTSPKRLATIVRWQRANPDKHYQSVRKYRLKQRFGITPEMYDAMLSAQSGRCAICKMQPGHHRKLAVDHCHQTAKVRGLLCFRCNTVLGRVYDDAMLLRALADYLTNNSPQKVR